MNSSSAQNETGAYNYRGKLGLRGAGGNGGLRPATRGGSENVNHPGAMGSQRSPRLGLCGGASSNVRPLAPLASSRQQRGTTFGTDITNIAGKAFGDKFKPLKQLAPTQQAELPIATSPSIVVEVPVAKTELANVQEVEEYLPDITEQLFRDEGLFQARADYMDIQSDLTPRMRVILMDWLIEVHMKYKLCSETLHLAVNLIDRYLTEMPVVRKKLQLVGVVAMFIASKFEEISPPELHDWVYITDKAYTKEDVLTMECTMLAKLSFKIVVTTPAHFLPGLQKANGCNIVHSELVQYIIELGLLDMRMLEFKPSQRVAAALLLSNELLGRVVVWPQNMVTASRHAEAALRSCVEISRQLLEADRANQGGQMQAVHKKFSTKEHHSVATMRL